MPSAGASRVTRLRSRSIVARRSGAAARNPSGSSRQATDVVARDGGVVAAQRGVRRRRRPRRRGRRAPRRPRRRRPARPGRGGRRPRARSAAPRRRPGPRPARPAVAGRSQGSAGGVGHHRAGALRARPRRPAAARPARSARVPAGACRAISGQLGEVALLGQPRPAGRLLGGADDVRRAWRRRPALRAARSRVVTDVAGGGRGAPPARPPRRPRSGRPCRARPVRTPRWPAASSSVSARSEPPAAQARSVRGSTSRASARISAPAPISAGSGSGAVVPVLPAGADVAAAAPSSLPGGSWAVPAGVPGRLRVRTSGSPAASQRVGVDVAVAAARRPGGPRRPRAAGRGTPPRPRCPGRRRPSPPTS